MKEMLAFYKRNFKKLILLQILGCALLIVVINLRSKEKREVNFDTGNLSGGMISEDGCFYIDESDGNYGYVLDTTTGKVKRGWYKVRVEYETGYDDNGFIVQALESGNVLNVDIGNEERAVSLKSYHNSREVHAWLKKDSDMRIAVHFCGGGYLQIKRISLRQIPNYTPVFLAIVCILFVNIELYERVHFTKEEVRRRRMVRCGIASIVLIGSIPLMNDFNIHGHDYKYHLYCMEGVAEGLLSGQFPVKIMPNWWNEFGDGAPMFYGDIMLYIPAFIMLLGYSIQTAYKCYIVFINLLTAWIAYKCFFRIAENEKIALAGAFLYSLNLYRLIDIYVRCAVGEYTALTFLPLVLLGIYLIEEDGWIYMVIGLTGCIQSHILVCAMMAGFFVLFCIAKIKWILKRAVFINFCKAGILTILWNLWFIISFLEVYLSKSYKIHIYEIKWKFEEKGIPFCEIFKLSFNGMDESFFAMGLPLLLGLVFSIMFLVFYSRKILKNDKNRRFVILLNSSICLALLALLLSMDFIPYSRLGSIHEIINRVINIFEFPFRFMVMASLFSTIAVVSTCALWKDIKKNKEKQKKNLIMPLAVTGIVGLTAVGALVSYWKLLTRDFPYVKNYEYAAIEYIMDMDKWMPMTADEADLSHELLKSSESVEITDYQKNYTNIDMTCIYEGVEEGYVDVPLFYYPCYKARDAETREILPLTYGKNCRVRIILPPGYHGTIILRVAERKIWRIAELISIISIIITIYMAVKGPGIKYSLRRLKREN